MVKAIGLSGLRPNPREEHAARLACPPYDVIKPGSALAARLGGQPDSLFHVILGDSPVAAVDGLVSRGVLIEDREPAFYVYEQRAGDETRTGVFVAVEVTDYSAGQIIRHEKTFDAKVKGRIALAAATGLTTEPIFLLTRAPIEGLLAEAKGEPPLYDFIGDFGGGTDLHEVSARVWRVTASSSLGSRLSDALAPEPLYIADGHHRYHAALRGGHSHVLAYVTERARILAYDRVVNPIVPFAKVRSELALTPRETFSTPEKNAFALYTREGCWTLRAREVPDDVVGRLDCSILERELYPRLGLEHRHIVDPAHFDYYPENALDEMVARVDAGDFELAIALHPVSLEELIAVADAGMSDPDIVMPEKSTFFSPKILSGLFLYRFEKR